MTTSAEEALARAKAIAAQLTGSVDAGGTGDGAAVSSTDAAATSTAASSTTATTTKRKRWGVAPPAIATVTPGTLPGLAEAAQKKQKQDEPVTKRLWVPTSADRPTTHFKSYLSDRMEDTLIRLNRENGTPGDEKNSLQLGGRGAATKVLPGMPLEPMHVMISGSPAFVDLATQQVDELLQQAEKAPLEGPPPPPPPSSSVASSQEAGTADRIEDGGSSLANNNDNPYYRDPYSGALSLPTKRFNGTTEATASYRPATVAQLIAGTATGGPGDAMNDDDRPLMEETIHVPNGIVGFLIGRGGETITSLQAKSGAKVQIQKEHELQPGQTHRVITLQATRQEAIDRVREMIENMVEERVRASGKGSGGGGGGSASSSGGHYGPGTGLGFSSASNPAEAKVQEALALGHVVVEMEVPDADVGLIIGKGGQTIKSIQETTGSNIQIPPSGSNTENPSIRKISVTHPTEEGAQATKLQIENILKSKLSGGSGAVGSVAASHSPQVTIEVMIPDRDVGLCIGRQGCVINEMQRRTGTRINIPGQPIPGQQYRVATVSGSQSGCDQAQALIQQISQDQSSACVMSGTPYNNNNHQGGYRPSLTGGYNRNSYPQHHQQAQQSNDPAWQAYYAAQKVAQQQQQEQQQAAAAAPAPDSYYDAFFRYEYYYGEAAARAYYKTWSPPPGTPNPYGTNPNGITTAPAAASGSTTAESKESNTQAIETQAHAGTNPSASVAATPSLAEGAAVPRDSSKRRGVSNLPAWMTRGS